MCLYFATILQTFRTHYLWNVTVQCCETSFSTYDPRLRRDILTILICCENLVNKLFAGLPALEEALFVYL